MISNQCIPILVYHHVYGDNSADFKNATFDTGAGIIGEYEFRRQIRYISDQGWAVVSTTQVVNWLIDDGPIPEKSVVLHFDNGWLDTATVTLPILEEFNMTATCFPITDGLNAASEGKTATVRTLTEGLVEKPFMTWDQVGILLEAGWEIGAHTASHCKMENKYTEEGNDGIINEAEKANAFFNKYLNIQPEHFAYPSGSHNERTDSLLARYYRSLRLWHFEWPIQWSYTCKTTSPLAVDCQNIDLRVPFTDFTRIFCDALDR